MGTWSPEKYSSRSKRLLTTLMQFTEEKRLASLVGFIYFTHCNVTCVILKQPT